MLLDLSNIQTDTYSTLPEGKYVCSVTNVEIKDTKTGSGQYLKTELTVIDGEAKGRKIFTQFNIKNTNQDAVAIGLKQLKTMLTNANYTNVERPNISEITGLTVGVKTRIKHDDTYGDKAEVAYFFNAKNTHQSQGIPF